MEYPCSYLLAMGHATRFLRCRKGFSFPGIAAAHEGANGFVFETIPRAEIRNPKRATTPLIEPNVVHRFSGFGLLSDFGF